MTNEEPNSVEDVMRDIEIERTLDAVATKYMEAFALSLDISMEDMEKKTFREVFMLMTLIPREYREMLVTGWAQMLGEDE